MDFRDLRYFRAITEQCSFSRAADVLQISQHALSRAVQRLEIDLDAALFERHGHGARLTETGRVSAKRTNTLLRQIEQTRAEIQGGIKTPSGVLDFAIPPGAAIYLVPPIISALRAEFPNVFFRVNKGFSGQLSDWMLRGQVDLACIHDPAPMRGVTATPLVDEEVFLVGRDIPIQKDIAGIPDLSDLPLILPSRAHSLRQLIERLATERGTPLHPIAEVDGQPIIKLLPREGIGASLLTWGAISEEVERSELTALKFRPALRWPPTLLERNDAVLFAPHTTLVETIRQVARALTDAGTWPGQSLDPSD